MTAAGVTVAVVFALALGAPLGAPAFNATGDRRARGVRNAELAEHAEDC